MRTLSILLLFIPFISVAQYQPLSVDESGTVYMEKVIQAPGLSSDDLYLIVLDWYSETFTNPESVINFNDRELGKINGRFGEEYEVGFMTFRLFMHSLSVQMKDERLKVRIDDIYNIHDQIRIERYILYKDRTFKTTRLELQKSVRIELNYIISSLEKTIQTPEGKDEEW